MRRKHVVGIVIGLAFLGALVYFTGKSQAPSGQPDLTNLTPQNVNEIRNEFNADKDKVRVLLLLSPT